MTYVGAFANSDIHPDLLIVTSIHKPPREAVRLCRLSDGLRLTLLPSRVSVIPDGTGAFEEHMAVEIKKARKLSSSLVAPKSPRSEVHSMDEYLEITSLADASYRLPAVTTYLIQHEYKRFSHPKYSVANCWRDICVRCDLFGLPRPTLGFVRSRLAGYGGHLFRAGLEQLKGDKYGTKVKQRQQ